MCALYNQNLIFIIIKNFWYQHGCRTEWCKKIAPTVNSMKNNEYDNY